jgi:REP element-mobilizing transposase RayT
MHVHLVFIAKYRRRVFTRAAFDDLREIFVKVCQDFESQLVELDGEDDHVHLLVNYPPKLAVSKLVNSIKGVLSPSQAAPSRHHETILAWCSLVAELLRRGLWGSLAVDHQAIRGEPTDT